MLPIGFNVPPGNGDDPSGGCSPEPGRISAADDAAQIDPAVVRSWRRCIVRANPLADFRPQPVNPPRP